MKKASISCCLMRRREFTGKFFVRLTFYSLQVENSLYFCTLVELPSIVEAQKTLDFKTFYKSLDVAQMLYVHNEKIEDTSQFSVEQLKEFGRNFNPH